MGFNVVDISSFTVIDLFFWGTTFVSFFMSSKFKSDEIRNSILNNFEHTTFIELATKSLYLFSKISWVKELGTLIFIVSEEIEIGSQLFIQVLKLTSLISPFIIFNVFCHSSFRSVSIYYPPKKKFYYNYVLKIINRVINIIYQVDILC